MCMSKQSSVCNTKTRLLLMISLTSVCVCALMGNVDKFEINQIDDTEKKSDKYSNCACNEEPTKNMMSHDNLPSSTFLIEHHRLTTPLEKRQMSIKFTGMLRKIVEAPTCCNFHLNIGHHHSMIIHQTYLICDCQIYLHFIAFSRANRTLKLNARHRPHRYHLYWWWPGNRSATPKISMRCARKLPFSEDLYIFSTARRVPQIGEDL